MLSIVTDTVREKQSFRSYQPTSHGKSYGYDPHEQLLARLKRSDVLLRRPQILAIGLLHLGLASVHGGRCFVDLSCLRFLSFFNNVIYTHYTLLTLIFLGSV